MALPVPGIRLAAIAAGIRYQGRDDLALIELAAGGTAAAVFTRNAFCAAPVTVAKTHLVATMPRYLVINSGNANAGTGVRGLHAATETCAILAAAAGCRADQVLPFSTGVIGEDLPLKPFAVKLPGLLRELSAHGWDAVSRAILTTDTRPKLVSRSVKTKQGAITITGTAKGSGMICPDMATMLAFIATDATASADLLQQCLTAATAVSFNAITVDGDTSTNDACVLLASGASRLVINDLETSSGQAFLQGITEVCMALARAIIKDGEGATKLVTVRVEGARSLLEARQVGYTVAHSPLVKTAVFASDPNWGRILAAVGRAGLEDLDIEAVRIWLGDTALVTNGGRDPGYTEAAGQAVMSHDEILIRIALGRGPVHAEILTCDLSYDYVKINAEYRT